MHSNPTYRIPIALGILSAAGLFFASVALAAPSSIELSSATQTRSAIDLNSFERFNVYSVTFTNTGTETETVMIDLELYNRVGRLNQVFERHTIAAGQSVTVGLSIDLPQYAPQGIYRLKGGIFTQDWSSQVRWYDEILRTDVTGGTSNADLGVVTMTSSSIDKTVMIEGENQVTGTATFMAEGPSGATIPALIDFELYRDGVKVAQTFWGDELVPGRPHTRSDLLVSGNAQAGHYVWKVGIFRMDWSGPVKWYESVREFDVLPAGSDLGNQIDVYAFSHEGALPAVQVGMSNRLTVEGILQGSGSRDVVIDAELYNEHGVRVDQQFANLSLNYLTQNTASVDFHSPVTLPAGNYTWKVGVFDKNWTSLMHWYDTFARFTVTN